jgi:signal peptidase I
VTPEDDARGILGHFLAAATLAGVAVLLTAVLGLLVALWASQGAYSANPVLSGSMRPAIQPGDVAVLERVPVSSLRVGDVLAYRAPDGSYRLHRLVVVDLPKVQTKGDANQSPDEPVKLVGSDAYRLVAAIPYVGWLLNAKAAVWLVAGLALVFVFGKEGLSLVRSVTRNRKKEGHRSV